MISVPLFLCRENTTEDLDFVFEEFVRLRVAGMEDPSEVEA